MILSIIIPYYNTKEYTDELLACLGRQIHLMDNPKEVEVVLIDDGSDVPYRPKFDFVDVIRTKNRGQSKARNLGLNRALGEYVQFIDSDDMVAEDFISKVIEKTKEGNDIIEFSWRSLNVHGARFNYRINAGERLTNPSACTRTFKRSYIGKVRFSEKKDATEDEDFSRRLGYLYEPVKVSVIPDYMYFYRTDVIGSNTKRYKNGLCKTKRIVYYYENVTADRTDILESIKADDETNEVILLTNRCDIPELKRWCQIYRPTNLWTHYLKGEPFIGCSIVQVPEQYEIVLFINYLHIIGGIETFVYHFTDLYKNVTLLVGSIHIEQRKRLNRHCKVVDYDPRKSYSCDTLILIRILDQMPDNIKADRTVRMCHGCRTNPRWHIPQDADSIVCVSEVCKKSFEKESENAMVIHNPIKKTDQRALILVSATRIPAPDKGNNEMRMRTLAERMNEAGIPFIWFNFSDGKMNNPPRGMVNVGTETDIQPYIARADYLVQLSDSEAWSYSILEALVNGTAALVCPFPSAEEMGIEDGVNGYLIPFDMGFDVNRLLTVPTFNYEYDNKEIKKKWDKILKSKPKPKTKGVKVRVTTTYIDTEFRRQIPAGEIITVSESRAKHITSAGFGEII